MTCRGLARAIACAAMGALLLPASAAAGWSAPFRLTPPEPDDVGPAQLAVSPSGGILAGFSVFDEDDPAASQGYLVERTAGGRVLRPVRLAGAKEVLSVAFAGRSAAALVGAGAVAQPCCQAVRLISLGRRPARVAGRLKGPTVGRLVALAKGGIVIAFAGGQGVWAARADPRGEVGAPRRLTATAAIPWALAAAPTGDGGAEIGWLVSRGPAGESGPRRVMVTPAGPGRTLRPYPLYTAPDHRRLTELGLAPRGAGVAAAWVETWFDNHGSYHSTVFLLDPGSRPRALAASGAGASGLSFSGAASGQVLAFKLCSRGVHCTVVALRSGRGGTAGPTRLGTIDPGQDPVTAIGADGTAVVGWIDHGHVLAAWRGPGPHARWRRAEVSRNVFASDLTLATGGSEVAAAWTEGTLAPVVAGAVLRGT